MAEIQAHSGVALLHKAEETERHVCKRSAPSLNESMSETSSVSEFESELGYASCENNEDSPESCVSDDGHSKGKVTRRKLQRKHRLDQLRKCDIYSNDSDTTIEETINNARKLKRPVPKREVVKTQAKDCSVKSKTNEFRRQRNGSKGSWTDSGVSMSKTDSQPSTLGERPKSTRMMSQKNATKIATSENNYAKVRESCKEFEESPVELLRCEISRRSRSVSECAKNIAGEKNEKPLARSKVKGSEKADDDMKKEEMRKRSNERIENERKDGKFNGKQRFPEIIKFDDKEKLKKVVKVPSKSRANKGEQADASLHFQKNEMTMKNGKDFEQLNEKEAEIIMKLVENAKSEESKRKGSLQSHWSQSTGESDDKEAAKPSRSKLQRLKDIFIKRVQRSRNFETSYPSPVNKQLKRVAQRSASVLDDCFSDDTSILSDHHCCCEYDGDFHGKEVDQLSHLGRVVHAKKRSFIYRLFRNRSKSNDNMLYGDGRLYRTRSQLEPDIPIGRKRSGSTRSLPESLRFLWLRAVSKSAENLNEKLPNVLQQSEGFNSGFYVKRSRSNSSLYKGSFHADISRSNDAIAHALSFRSPPTPVRRSESLRSLNIGKNYDIAIQVLQARPLKDDIEADNNNLLYHPYFEGHTTRDDCNIEKRQDQDGNCCNCCLNSPQASPCFKGNSPIVTHSQSNYQLNNRCLNEPMRILSPRRRASMDTSCCCQDNLFRANHIMAGDTRDNLDCDEKSSAMEKDFEGRMKSPRHDKDFVVAPLEVKITKERHAGRVRLKTGRDVDSSV